MFFNSVGRLRFNRVPPRLLWPEPVFINSWWSGLTGIGPPILDLDDIQRV